MVFSYLTFLYMFLPLCLLAYYLVPTPRLRNAVLLAASLIFYAFGEPAYILLMVAAAGSAYAFAIFIDRWRGTGRARLFLALSVLVNVGFLFYYKYVPLFAETAASLFGLNMTPPRIALPIGISFYTFQILTYTVDIYFGKTELQRSPVKFLLYVSMFPQLIAGPIVRYSDVAAQLDRRAVTVEIFASGVLRFVCGLSKKLLLADYAGKIADSLLGGAGLAAGAGGLAGAVGAADAAGGISTLAAWFGLLLFTFQIYFDFSGYSDMAIGLGRMFGFEFMENFDHPYASKSVTEFWRRWHMSLGTFFRDYVYIPLGGNRRHQLRNIAVVWVLTGFWHGASWNFVLWGCYFGALLILEKYVLFKIPLSPPAPLRAAYSFFLAVVGWCIFYYTDLGRIGDTFGAMFAYRPETDFQTRGVVSANLAFAAVCFFISMPWAKKLYSRALAWAGRRAAVLTAAADSVLSLVYVLVLLLACSTAGVGSSFSPFLYFRF